MSKLRCRMNVIYLAFLRQDFDFQLHRSRLGSSEREPMGLIAARQFSDIVESQ